MPPQRSDHLDLLADWEWYKYRDQFAILHLLLITVCIKLLHTRMRAWRLFKIIPESLLLICCGAVIGALMTYVLPEDIDRGLWRITPHAFFAYLLPITILDAAYHLYNRAFADTVVGVVVYAVVATVLNMVLIGLCLVGMEWFGFFAADEVTFTTQVLFLYASFIVAVDPVAVLALFHEIGVNPCLYYLALGESLFNDGVTLILYKIVHQFLDSKVVTARAILIGLGAFFTISLGAILVGIVLGVLACLVTKYRTHFEAVFLLGIAYTSYILGDVLGWSGLVALITCAMIQGAYAFHNLEANDLYTLRCISRQMSEICEGIIFLLIGIKLLEKQLYWHVSFNLWSLLTCLVVRALVVFLLSLYINRFYLNISTVSLTEQFILAYGGLRGAVALSLAIMVDKQKVNQRVYDTLVTSTLFTILFTVGVMGPTMRPLVKILHVKLAQRKTISLVRELNERMIDEITMGVEGIIGRYGRNSLRACFVRLDEGYIRGFLQRQPSSHNAGIVKVYEEMALVLHLASLRSPQQAAAIMRDLPATIQSRQFEAINLEHEATREEMQKMTQFSAAHSFLGGMRRRNATLYLEDDCGTAPHRRGLQRLSFLCEMPKFLAAKKAQILRMSSQLAETSLSDRNANARSREEAEKADGKTKEGGRRLDGVGR
ncbi:Sodium/hydrogen exchanger 2 [Taenia solium]|eukprot:TsM_001174400 transcript=TsM_001174400 gene=TsM_001174400